MFIIYSNRNKSFRFLIYLARRSQFRFCSNNFRFYIIMYARTEYLSTKWVSVKCIFFKMEKNIFRCRNFCNISIFLLQISRSYIPRMLQEFTILSPLNIIGKSTSLGLDLYDCGRFSVIEKIFLKYEI